MSENSNVKAYSRRDWFWAVSLSGALTGLMFISSVFMRSNLGETTFFTAVKSSLTVSAYALPVMILIAWITVAWPLRILMRQPISWTGAVVWGLILSLGIVLFSIMIGRTIHALSPASLEASGFTRLNVKDWSDVLEDSLYFIGSSLFTALILRFIFGPGDTSPSAQQDS